MCSWEESSRSRRPMTDSGWRDFFRSFDGALNDTARAVLGEHSVRIRRAIEELDAIMDRYCAQTCPWCRDPCCAALRVAYNLNDMVYLFGLGVALPVGQTRQHHGAPCRYWLSSGCALPRILRPYVCTWFFCEPHMERFFREPARFQRHIIGTLQEIRRLRTAMLAFAAPYLPAPWSEDVAP
uniref:Uncharacterized protein n=1 Tax=Desulfacinum infernum TaxID=35837 RepID=A0A832A323_9BACT